MTSMSSLLASTRLLAALSCGLLAAGTLYAADVPSAALAPAAAGVQLPAKPSELVRAPLAAWEPVLLQVGAVLEERAHQADALSRAEKIELGIQRLMLAQTRRSHAQVLAALEQARGLQESEAGRQTAGLLNEMLARQALQHGDSAWLKQALKARVLAMPWAEVEPAIRTLRNQMASMQEAGVDTYIANKLDLSASVATNRVSLGFVMQLMGLRFQLLEVLPQRAALLVALDEAIAQRSDAPAAQH